MVKKKISDNIVIRFIKEAISELKRVVWPKRKDVIKMTLIVVISMIIIAALTGALDYGLSKGVDLLINLK